MFGMIPFGAKFEGDDGDAGAGGSGGGENTPAVFDIAMVVPTDSLPAELSMYGGKTAGEVFSGVASMRKTLSDQGVRAKEYESTIEKQNKQISDLQNSSVDPDMAPLGVDKLQAGIAHYHQHNSIPEGLAEAAATKGIIVPNEELADYFRFKSDQRNDYFRQGNAWLEDQKIQDVNFEQVHEFMHSDRSGYTKEDMFAFARMERLSGGDMSFMVPVIGRFNEAITEGYTPQQMVSNMNSDGSAMPQGTYRQGRPVQATTKGFSSQAAYQAASDEASKADNPSAAQLLVDKKMGEGDPSKWKDKTWGGISGGSLT